MSENRNAGTLKTADDPAFLYICDCKKHGLISTQFGNSPNFASKEVGRTAVIVGCQMNCVKEEEVGPLLGRLDASPLPETEEEADDLTSSVISLLMNFDEKDLPPRPPGSCILEI